MMDGESGDDSDDDNAMAELMGYDKWPGDVAAAFDHARGRLSVAQIKNRKKLKNDFASVVADFRALETEFAERVGNEDENVRQLRRIVAEMLLDAAWYTEQPFETCLKYWQDLQELGFYRVEREGLHTGSFAACCLHHGQIDLGLALIDPFIAKIERLRAESNVTEQALAYYAEEIESFGKLRARLEAARG
jgi:hypothetical protein